MAVPSGSIDGFSAALREWRKIRRLSQLELSTLASISARHISFLEQGRSKPSRNMVLKLAAAMDISPTATNAALTKAGFANAYPKAELGDDNVRSLSAAVKTMLENHMPWPALVCDQSWSLLDMNPSAEHFLQLLGATRHDNLMLAMLSADDPDGPFINWTQIAHLMLRRLDAEQLQRPDDESLRTIRTQLRAHPRLQDDGFEQTDELSVTVPIVLRSDDQELTLVSMIAQFGAIQEITYSGIHIELFFPEDTTTEQYFMQFA